MFQAGGPVRSAPVAVTEWHGYSLIFGDQNGGVYALDAKPASSFGQARRNRTKACAPDRFAGRRKRRGVRAAASW